MKTLNNMHNSIKEGFLKSENLLFSDLFTSSKENFKSEIHTELLGSYVKISNIDVETHLIKFAEVTKETITKTHYIAETGDIIFVKQRPQKDKFAYVHETCIVPMSCLVLKPKEPFNSYLLFALLMTKEVQTSIENALNKNKNGQSITNDDVMNLQLPLRSVFKTYNTAAIETVAEFAEYSVQNLIESSTFSLNELSNSYFEKYVNQSSEKSILEGHIYQAKIGDLFESVKASESSESKHWQLRNLQENDYKLPKFEWFSEIGKRPPSPVLEVNDIVLTFNDNYIHSALVSKNAIDWTLNDKQIVIRLTKPALKELKKWVQKETNSKIKSIKNFQTFISEYIVFYFRTKEMKITLTEDYEENVKQLPVKVHILFEFISCKIRDALSEFKDKTEAKAICQAMSKIDIFYNQLINLEKNLEKKRYVKFENRVNIEPHDLQDLLNTYLLSLDKKNTEDDIAYCNYPMDLIELNLNEKQIAAANSHLNENDYIASEPNPLDAPNYIIAAIFPLDEEAIEKGTRYSKIIEIEEVDSDV